MTALFGAALFIGFVMLVVWIGATIVAGSVGGREHQDPELRFGVVGRSVMAGVFGFGMAGLSSLYAGWPIPVVLASAVFGAAALIGVGIWLGPTQVE